MLSGRYLLFGVTALGALVLISLLHKPEVGEKQKGVCWVASHEPVTEVHLEALVKNNVSWISQTPFGWQRTPTADSIGFITTASTANSRGVMWGESDEGITATVQLARKKGIKTILKPHIWVRQSWPGDIEMTSEVAWKNWFAQYEKFILHYAQVAEQNQVEVFCIGTELSKTIKREAQWRALIKKVKTVYKGKLTYAANFHDEYELVKFWDELDFIGIQAYFPLSQNKNATVAELTRNWNQPMSAIERMVYKFQKPVLFTELGYRSTADAAIEPWVWPQQIRGQAEPSEEMQARCYQAFFNSAWKQKWLEGVYFWKWYPAGARRLAEIDFTPQGKAAEQVMAQHFSNHEERH